MKLISFVDPDGRLKPGAIMPDMTTVVDLSASFVDMLALIEGGPIALEDARQEVAEPSATLPLSDVKLRAPVPIPQQVRDCMCFEKHLKQALAQGAKLKAGVLGQMATGLGVIKIPKVWYRQPIYYKSNRFSVIGPEQDVIWPSYSQKMDYELEMGMIVGKRGKDIPKDKAREHIFGYLIFNDMSARDAQFDEMDARLGPAKGKDFDTGNVMGPWLVTADEIADPYNLEMVVRVNGEERGRGNSKDMYHKFEDVLAHVSKSETVYPGEFFGSGTVGDGCGLEHGRFLEPNDLIEL